MASTDAETLTGRAPTSPIDAYKRMTGTADKPLAYFEVVDSVASTPTDHRRALQVAFTMSGAKGGAYYARPVEVALTVSAAIEGATALRLSTATSGNPAISGWLHALDIYASDCGSGCENHCVVNIGKVSTNTGTVDSFVRMRTHGGTTGSFFRIEGTSPATYLFDIQNAQTPVFGNGSGSKASGGTCKALQILIAGTPYRILAAEEWV